MKRALLISGLTVLGLILGFALPSKAPATWNKGSCVYAQNEATATVTGTGFPKSRWLLRFERYDENGVRVATTYLGVNSSQEQTWVVSVPVVDVLNTYDFRGYTAGAGEDPVYAVCSNGISQ